MSTITTGKVVIYKPNFNVNPVDTLLDLPVLGAENTLYVIKDTGAIYLWNGSEFITTTTPTSKTVYVDDTYGNDDTGMKEFVNLPFKTINAAVAELESGDKLVIGEGDYTWSNSLPVVSDISVEAKGNITKTTALIAASADETDKKLTFKSDDFTSSSSITFVKNTFVDFFIKTFNWSSSFIVPPQIRGNITINNLIKTTTGSLFFINSWEDYLNININNYIYTNSNTSGYQFFLVSFDQGTAYDALDKTGSRLTLNVENYTANAYLSGLWGSYDVTSKSITNHQWVTTIKNVKQVGWNAGITNYYGLVYDDRLNTNYSGNIMTFNLSNVDIDYPLFYRRRGSSCDFVFNIDDLKINYSSLLMTNSATTALLNSNIIYNVKKGVVYTLFDFNAAHTTSTTLTNSTIVINGDFTTNTDVVPRFILDATSKIVFKGRFNLGDKKIDLSNITGAGADNIYFDDCTIITTGTNSIDAGSAKNIKVKSTYSNKVDSANITALIDPIVVNAIIN